MKDGLVKITACATNIIVADCNHNSNNIIQAIMNAQKEGAKLVTLGELALQGKTSGDLLTQPILVSKSTQLLVDIVNTTAGNDTLVVVGSVLANKSRLYNCAVVIQNGAVLGVVPKTNLDKQDKDIFDNAILSDTITIGDKEYPFGMDLIFECMGIDNFRFGVVVGELKHNNNIALDLASKGCNVLVNITACENTTTSQDQRLTVAKAISLMTGCCIISSQNGKGESTTDSLWGGHNFVVEDGQVVKQGRWEDATISTEIDLQVASYGQKNNQNNKELHKNKVISFGMDMQDTIITRDYSTNVFVNPQDNSQMELVLTVQSMALSKRMEHTKSKHMILGISGGLDSALAMIVAVRTAEYMGMDKKSIIAVSMPCFGTSQRTKNNAKVLSNALGVDFREIDITKTVLSHFADINQDKNTIDVTYENAQARERTQVIMDIANQVGGIVVGTGDMSEIALGWSTYNGDHMSNYGVNSNIPKTVAQHLVRYFANISDNKVVTECLLDIVDTPISPELLPTKNGEISQSTEDLVGPYELHDFIMYYFLKYKFSPAKILRLAQLDCAFGKKLTKEQIKMWINKFFSRFFASQFKRSCSPDGIKVFDISLSPRDGWNMPSDASANVWLEQLKDIE